MKAKARCFAMRSETSDSQVMMGPVASLIICLRECNQSLYRGYYTPQRIRLHHLCIIPRKDKEIRCAR